MAVNVRSDEDDDETEGDMTPMIDIIFLLLVFFILTTKFIPEEKVISSLLPTDKGTSSASPTLEEKEQVNIKILPGIFKNRLEKPSLYDQEWKDSYYTLSAIYQVGNNPFVEVEGKTLSVKGGNSLEGALGEVHTYLHGQLSRFETAGGARSDQPPIIIHGFSGLPWKYVLASFDAVRAYENQFGFVDHSREGRKMAREVTFAPPRVRGYRKWEMGYELFEIHHME